MLALSASALLISDTGTGTVYRRAHRFGTGDLLSPGSSAVPEHSLMLLAAYPAQCKPALQRQRNSMTLWMHCSMRLMMPQRELKSPTSWADMTYRAGWIQQWSFVKCYGKHTRIHQGVHCRFGLNGRSLILQAAQRAAKKPKLCHGGLGESQSFSSTSKATFAATSHQLSGATSGSRTAVGEAFSDENQQEGPPVTQQPTQLQHDSTSATSLGTSKPSGTAQPMPEKQGSAGAISLKKSAAPSTAQADALIEGLDPHDQPLVAYINRSSVPRILRQVCTHHAPLASGTGVLRPCITVHAALLSMPEG